VAVQLTEKLVEAVLPASTVTVRGFCPSTEQLDLMPESSTEWSPSERPEKVAVPLGSRSFEVEPSTVAV